MGKKIVVITGSPRKGGNSSVMVDAFTAAAEGVGHVTVHGALEVGAIQKTDGCAQAAELAKAF